MPDVAMKSIRNQPTAFRFDPTVKASLSLIAEREGRSMANMLEWLIRRHCETEGLGWPPPGCTAPDAKKLAPRQAAPNKGGVMKNEKKGKRNA